MRLRELCCLEQVESVAPRRAGSGSLAHLMVQLSWIVTQNSGGGYFVLVGRKRA